MPNYSYPNVPEYPAVPARPFNVEPQTALLLLRQATNLVANSTGGDEVSNLAYRCEAARTVECLSVVLGGEQAAEQDVELVPAAQAYLRMVASMIRSGARDWPIMAISRLRFAWG